MTQKHIVLGIGGLIAGVGLGLFVSLVFFSLNDSKSVNTPHKDMGPLTPKTEFDIDSSAIVQNNLDSIFELETAPARRLALYELIGHKSGQQIADLLRQSFYIDSHEHISAVQRLLFSALARLNPEFSLELVWQSERSNWDEFFTIVVEAWASADPELALQTSSELGEPWQSKAFRTIFRTRQDFSDAKRLELAKSFGATSVLKEVTLETRIHETIDEPKKAFELILQADISDYRKNEIANWVTKRWIEHEGTSGISSMLSLVHEMFSPEQTSWRPVVALLAATDPKFVWEELSKLSVDAQKMLNDEVFRVWLRQDPMEAENALKQTENLAAEGPDLNPLYALWASVIWEQLAEKIQLVPVDLRSNMLREAVGRVATRLEPMEMLDQLEKIQRVGVNVKSTLEMFARIWGVQNPAAALDWAIENLEPESWVISVLLMELAATDANVAMEIALEQPASTRAERSVVQSLFSEGRLEQGLEFLPLVREGLNDVGLYASAGELLIDSGRTSEALVLAKKLPEESHLEYFENLASRWIYKGFHAFIPVLPQLPSEEIRSYVAEYILRVGRGSETLTDDEMDVVRSFVQETAD